MNAAQNLNVIRKVAINLLKADRTSRRSFKKKLLTMTWNDEMLRPAREVQSIASA